MQTFDEHFGDLAPEMGEESGPQLSEAQQQWLAASPKLRPELKTDLRAEYEGLFVVIEDPIRNKFYSVGKKEHRLLSCLNGVSTLNDVVKNWRGVEPIDEKSAVTICQWALQSNLLICDQMDAMPRLEKQSQALQRQKLMSTFNPISIKFKLLNPNRFLQKLLPYGGWFFSKTMVAVWAIVGLWALSSGLENWDRLSAASVGILSGFRWIWLLLIWALLKVFHEMAHGLACKKYGGEVNEAGVLFLLFTPMAFVNVTSSWRFPNRFHRIVVAGAGMYAELFISFIAMIVWSYFPDGIVSDVCYNIFFMSSVTTILFNANPLMRFDGYYILADSLAVTNLYTKGTKLFGDYLKSWYFGVPLTPNLCAPKEFKIAIIYGVFAFFWKISISVGLVIGASVLFYGLGKIMAAIGIALFFGLPIWQQVLSLYGPNAAVRPAPLRVAISTSVLVVFLLSIFFVIQAPNTKSAAAIVQFKNETPIRAGAEGFIETIFVKDGDKVAAGETLFELSNPVLNLDVSRLENEAAASRIQARVHQQANELALYQAELDKLAGINKQLNEKREQLQGLIVTSPMDGFVFDRDLRSKIGSFAKQGDILLNVAEEEIKEVVVSINQKDWDAVKDSRGQDMRVVIKSVPIFPAKISRIDGRATDVPQHPSLCANVGGPLPIKGGTPDDESESKYLLLTPHFSIDLEVDSEFSSRLRSGQRGRAFFATKSQSLGRTFLWP